ncbi:MULTISPECIES: hypothetical protein [unclassified Caballeronia]|uniref:hypothetical protein n=1 Tax=unclassified Caballeronia TaxID=2646786 RepID=UPI002867813E|nr:MULTISPECIES: hypothetical protein [unclassified Caballeronia]MDR5740830.1 hypothetical protein [Caballeronia sp. LZ016]MDR5808649.1 hypothetical protein [Caballeronia sp. LZ019]
MLRKAWRGEERFWKVWWLLGLPLHLAWWAVYLYLWGTGVAPEPFLLITIWFWPGMLGLFAACAALYLAWCTAAWRCSANVDRRVWTYVARVLIGVGLGSFLTECALILTAPFVSG